MFHLSLNTHRHKKVRSFPPRFLYDFHFSRILHFPSHDSKSLNATVNVTSLIAARFPLLEYATGITHELFDVCTARFGHLF